MDGCTIVDDDLKAYANNMGEKKYHMNALKKLEQEHATDITSGDSASFGVGNNDTITSAPVSAVKEDNTSINITQQHSLISSVYTVSVHSLSACDATQNDDITNLAPDGGWGWVILVAVFLSMVTHGVFLAAFSLMYTPLVEQFQAERGIIGWIGSIAMFSGNILGILLGAFIHRFGSRCVGMVGSLIWSTGVGLSALMINIPYLYFTYGIIAGIGFGMVFMSDIIILQLYFNKKRAMALGIGTAGLSLGAIVTSPLVNFLLNKYGLSGVYLISAGIYIHNIVLTALFRPLKMKSESKSKIDHTRKYESVGKAEDKDHQRVVPKRLGFCSDICDWTPLKNVKFVLYLSGVFLMHMGCVGFFSHFLSRSLNLGFARDTAILFQVIMDITGGLARLIFSFIANIKGVDRVLLYGILVSLDAVVIIGLPLAQTKIPVALAGAAHGAMSGAFFTVQPTVMVDVAGVAQIAKLTGFFTMTIAISILITVPLAGFIFDVTQSYDTPFFCIGAIHALGGGVLLVLAILNKTKWNTVSNNLPKQHQMEKNQQQDQ